MPVIRKAADTSWPASDRPGAVRLLGHEETGSDLCIVDRILVPAGQSLDRPPDAEALGWFQVLEGSGRIGNETVDRNTCGLLQPGTAVRIKADTALDILLVTVPQAARFDAGLDAFRGGIVRVDWSREPVLQSEHDARTRIYMATPSLVGTGAIKAEMITYPPGTSAPEHHHEGAEHFQFILSGRGTAVLGGAQSPLEAGDILYNYENELHYFFTTPDADEDFVFVEVFIPGHCKTVWAEAASACAWLPTGKDAHGASPVREIGYHVHGEDAGL